MIITKQLPRFASNIRACSEQTLKAEVEKAGRANMDEGLMQCLGFVVIQPGVGIVLRKHLMPMGRNNLTELKRPVKKDEKETVKLGQNIPALVQQWLAPFEGKPVHIFVLGGTKI